MKDLQSKVGFVTGGASGIGLGIAKAFLSQGMQVTIADVNPDSLDAARHTLGHSESLHCVELDVSDRAALEQAADEAEQVFGKVHVVCNNAGIACAGPGHLAPLEQWNRIMAVNLHGTLHGIQVFVPRIQKHGEGGHIVNTASLTGLFPNRSQFVYGTSKYAIVGMSEFLRDDLENENISVSVLCPNTVLTQMSAFREHPTDTDEIRAQRAAYMKKHGIVLEMPDNVGEMVVRGILNDELYIFTDGEQSRQLITSRFEHILGAFDQQFPG